MRNKLVFFFNCLVSILFMSQNTLADPAPAIVTPSRPTASAMDDVNLQVLYKMTGNEEIDKKLSEVKKHYTITLSRGKGAQDEDVMITRRAGNIYSFRYCKAHVPGFVVNPVDQLRGFRYSHPDIFLNQTSGNTDESDKILENLYNSAACDQSSHSLYALLKVYEVEDHKSAFSTYIHSVVSVEAAVGILTGTVLGTLTVTDYRKANNTLNFSRKIMRGSSPYTLIAAIGSLGAAAWFGSKPVLAKRSDARINTVADASYSFVYKKTFASSTLPAESNDVYSVVENVVDSMSEFKTNFDKGLVVLETDGTMARL